MTAPMRAKPDKPRRVLSLPMPAWMPKTLLARLAWKDGGKISSEFRFSEAERAVLRKRKP